MLPLLLHTNKKVYNLRKFVAFQMFAEFSRGDLVWFDPGIGYVLPGEVLEYHRTAQVLYIYMTWCGLTRVLQGYVLPGEVLEYHRTAQVLYIWRCRGL